MNHNSEEPAKRWAVKNGDFWSSYFLPPIFLPEMHLSDGCETDVVVRDVGPMNGIESCVLEEAMRMNFESLKPVGESGQLERATILSVALNSKMPRL